MADQGTSTEFIKSLPPLVKCEKLSTEQVENVRRMTAQIEDSSPEELHNLRRAYAEFSDATSDQDAPTVDELGDHSRYLAQIEKSFKTDWSEKNMENQSFLINAVSSVWLAGKRLATIHEDLHSIIIWHCPPACFMTSQQIDDAWGNIHTSFNSFIADMCTTSVTEMHSLSKDSLVDWSDKWIDILLDNLAKNTLVFAEENPFFNPYLFAVIKLYSLTGRLSRQCITLHATFAPRALPALKSILAKCPKIMQEFDMIDNLIAKKPKSNLLTEIWHNYTPDMYSIEVLKKRGKDFIANYSPLSDDIERYLSICNFNTLKTEFDEVILLQEDEAFNLAQFEEYLCDIQEKWDCDLQSKLHVYILELEFLSGSEKFQTELAKGREFLSKYECGIYEDFDSLNRHKKNIHDFTFSGHWLDSREEERRKLSALIEQIETEVICEDEDVVIFDVETGQRLLKIIEDDFNDFTSLHKTVLEYYDMGIEQWKDFLEDCRNLEECISKKSFLLSKGFVKFENVTTFPDNVRKLRIEIAELEHFCEALFRIQLQGDHICNISVGKSQEFIQSKLGHFTEKLEEMKLEAGDAYSELEPLIHKITELDEILTKIEEILRGMQDKIDSQVDDFKKAKADAYLKFLKTKLIALKFRTNKLSMVQKQLEPLLKIDSLDISQLENRYVVANGNLTNILEFLSKKLELAILAGVKKAYDQIIFGESNLDSYEIFFKSLANDNFAEHSSNVTKRLHELDDFFSNKYFEDLQDSIVKLEDCAKELLEDDVKNELNSLELSFNKLDLTVRSTKILIHFAITYHELDEVLKLRETFIQNSDRFSFADRLDFVSNQIDELFGEDFGICKTYYKQLRSRYNEYLCDMNQPPVLPLSLEVVSKLESQMRERLELLENSFSRFSETFREVENTVTQFRKESQNILAFVDKLEAAFQHKENSSIRDSNVLETQCQFWEILVLEGQKSLTQYDHSFCAAEAIYRQLDSPPKVVSAKIKFPKAKEYLDQLRSCLNLFQRYQSELKGIEDRFSTLTNDFSHFYTEMRFPSISINGSSTEKLDQTCVGFKNEMQAISESVRSMRLGITELHGGSHQIVDYSINEEKRLKALEDKLPEWRSKINGLLEECSRSSNASPVDYYVNNLDSISARNGHSSYEIISESEDSGAYNLSIGSKESPLSEEECKLEERFNKWKRWLKRKQKAEIMRSEISIKLREAETQKKEIEMTKTDFEKRKNDFQTLVSNKEVISNQKIRRLHKDVKQLFVDFEILMSKRCEDVSNKVSSLLELHLLITLCEKKLTSVESNLATALDRNNTLQEQIQEITNIRNELKECETEFIGKIREQYNYLVRDSTNNFIPVERSPEPSDSLSESDTDEKIISNTHSSNSETSFLLPPIPWLEQIQTVEATYKELYETTAEHINSLANNQETANGLSQQLENIRSKIQGINQDVSQPDNYTDFKLEYNNLSEEIQHIDQLYAPIEVNSALTRDELRLRREVEESIENLKYVAYETSPFNEMASEGFDSIVPIELVSIFEPKDTQTSAPLLLNAEIPTIDLPPNDDHNDESQLKDCFDLIAVTYHSYINFTVAGPHAANSEEEIVTEIKDKYTQTHTEISSIFMKTPDSTGYVKEKADSWLKSLQHARNTLIDQIGALKETWLGLEESYNDLHNTLAELQSEYEDFRTVERDDKLEFEIEVNTAQEHHQGAIENYNSFSPEMYQLARCEQDDICQDWIEKLDKCREKLQRLKSQFIQLIDSNPDSSPNDSPPPPPDTHPIELSPIPNSLHFPVVTINKETNTDLEIVTPKPPRKRFFHISPIFCFLPIVTCILAYCWFSYTSYLCNNPVDVPK